MGNLDLFILDMKPVSYAPWECVCSAANEAYFQLMAVVLLFGFAAAVGAFRKAAAGTAAKRRARAYMVAFGTRDVLLGAIILFATTTYSFSSFGENAVMDLLFLQGTALVMLIFIGLVAYGVLKEHLFDIDLKLRWTVKQGTVAAVFVAAFFGMSELAQGVVSERAGPFLGAVAAALLVFALAPLQRFGEGVARTAMPGVAETPEYLTYRKLEVYRAAVEGALESGDVSARERRILERLRTKLGIPPADAAALEADVRGRPAAATA